MDRIAQATARPEETSLRWPGLSTRHLVRLLTLAYRNGQPPFAGPTADELRQQIALRELRGVVR